MSYKLTIAERMKQYRLLRKWTIKRMAAVAGLSTTCVWNIENGKVQPHELTVAKIREALPVLFEEGAA